MVGLTRDDNSHLRRSYRGPKHPADEMPLSTNVVASLEDGMAVDGELFHRPSLRGSCGAAEAEEWPINRLY